MAIMATATNEVRLETQIRRTASRTKYESVLDGTSGSLRGEMKSRGTGGSVARGLFAVAELKIEPLPGFQWVAGYRSKPPRRKSTAMRKFSRLRKP